MRSANFFITPRASAIHKKNGNENAPLNPENVHVLYPEVHIKKTNGLICGNVDMPILLMILTAISGMYTVGLGYHSTKWSLLLTVFDGLGIVAYLCANINMIELYCHLLVTYVVVMLFTLVGILTAGVQATSHAFMYYNFDALARYCYNPDVIFFLVFFTIYFAVRIIVTFMYLEFLTLNNLLAKLRTQKFVLEARY